MGTGVPPMAPESMWPTGDMPRELVNAMRSEGIVASESTQEIVPANVKVPPREFDAAALEAERPPMTVEGDALLDNLRSALENGRNGGTRPAPMLRPAISVYASPADMHYAFPLSADGNRAEVNLYGKITADDVELLVDYLKLTAKKMVKHGEASAAGVPEHNSAGSDEKLPQKRSRVRSGTGR